ncbi:MAG: response regulator [Desulfovibrio sp.]|jgi:YesN/AraC family two-component response regulator|nr:response regulator [Desulfovibrio sp.]
MRTIAIVEDEKLERSALRSIITDHLSGCTIVGEAATGEEAITLIDKGGIELMLLDISIPHPDGLEVLQYLRDKNAETKVIITTAHETFHIAREAIHLKVDEYLLKPVRPQLLIEAIQTCLNISSDRSSRLRDMLRDFAGFLEQDLYHKGVILVRTYINAVYEQNEAVSDRMILDLTEALVQFCKDKQLTSEEIYSAQAYIRSIDRSKHNRYRVMQKLLTIINAIFDSTHDKYCYILDPMQRALNYIERNAVKGPTLEEISEGIYVSPCYLSRLFKKKLGVNFVAYLTNRRMELAKELLSGSKMSINAICQELSYNDLNYFCKIFKKETGMSPAKYRKQAGSAS